MEGIMKLFKRKPKLTGQQFTTGRHKYTIWDNELAFPLARYAEHIRLIELFSLGITGEEVDRIIAAMQALMSKGLNKPENVSKLGALIENLKMRRQYVLHKDLLINIVALHCIRSDEHAYTFDEHLHLEKVKDLADFAYKPESYAFFLQAGLEKLSGYMKVSTDELLKSINDSTALVRDLNKTLAEFIEALLPQQEPRIENLSPM
jgi:hypothetical protein